jgi:ATP-dependent helicase HrpA
VRAHLGEAGISSPHCADIEEQMEYLVYTGFIRDIPAGSLKRLPVYFQAINKRLDKMAMDSGQADRVLPLIRELWRTYLQLAEDHAEKTEAIERLRWMIEEYRISCFAQPMKTVVPVSENKIRKVVDEIAG